MNTTLSAAAAVPTTATTATTDTAASTSSLSNPRPPQSTYFVITQSSLSLSTFAPSSKRMPVDEEFLRAQIVAIQSSVKVLFTRLRGFQDAVWLNKVANFNQKEVLAMGPKIDTARGELVLRKRDVCAVTHTPAIPSLLQDLQELEVQLQRLSLEKTEVQSRLEDPQYILACQYLQSIQESCTREIKSTLPLTSRILACETLWRQIEEHTKSVRQPLVLAINIRIVDCLLPVLALLRTRNICDPDGGMLLEQVTAFTARLDGIEKALKAHRRQLVNSSVLDSRFAAEQKYSDDVLARFASSTTDASRFTCTTNWLKDWLYSEYYKQTNELLNQIEPVNRAVTALVSVVSYRTQCLAKAILTHEPSHPSLRAELDSYINVIKTCSFKIEQHLESFRTYAGTDKTYEVENHIAAIKEVLAEQKRAIVELEQLLTDEYVSVANAQNALMQFLQPPIGDTRFHLYHALSALAPIKTPSSAHESTVSVLADIMTHKGPAGLELTDNERAVWSALFRQDSLDMLRSPSAEPGSLPVAVRRFIEKQITQLFHFPDTGGSVAELELVLYMLESDPAYSTLYIQAKAQDSEFNQIVEAYRASELYRDERLSDTLLSLAATVCCLIERTRTYQKVTLYARLWQAFEEFQAKASASSEKPDVVLRMRQVLHNRIKSLADYLHYLVPDSCGEKLLYDELSSLQKKQEVFFRALACGICATDVDKQKSAQDIVFAYLDKKDAFFRELTDSEIDFPALINELSLQLIIERKFSLLSERAWKMFLAGPVSGFLTDDFLRDPRIPLALSRLVVYEEGKPTQPFRELVVKQLGPFAAQEFVEAARKMNPSQGV